jgi:hypothetical protein
MTSKDFFKEVKLEWCASEQQDKPLLNDMMKFAKLYHNEQLILSGVSHRRELFNAILDFSEELPMCTEDYHRSELWKKYKALNCG